MATNVRHSVLNASEEAVENACGFCKSRDKKEVESTSYCVECDSNMCGGCTEWHANFPLMRSHKAVGISKANIARKTRVQLPTQHCEVHAYKLIERFCVDHKQLACDACVSQEHRKCDNLEYIPVFSKGVKTSQELIATKTSTESTLNALKEFQSTQHETLQKLDTAELQCQQDLQDHRDMLVKRIDDLAKADSAKIHSKFQGERDAVQQSIKAADDQKHTMETIVKGLTQAKGDNEPELFVYMKQGEKSEKESKQLLHTQQQSQRQIPKYQFHTIMQKSLGDAKTLGEFEEVASLTPASLKPVSLKLRGEYNVKTAKDKSGCDIPGVCLLPDASVMITDCNNNSLKQLDKSYNVTRSLDLGATPWDICYTNSNNEVAVTLFSAKAVQFVSVGASLKKTRVLSVGKKCRGITCSDGDLFVCCGDLISVFSLAGILLCIIKPLFSSPCMVIASSCGNKLYVTNTDKGVITIDRSGNLKHQFQDGDLRDACGICTLGNGDLLVSGFDTHNVLHVSRDGRKLAVVLAKQDGLFKPQCLVFNPISSRLFVTTEDCDTIKVYDVK